MAPELEPAPPSAASAHRTGAFVVGDLPVRSDPWAIVRFIHEQRHNGHDDVSYWHHREHDLRFASLGIQHDETSLEGGFTHAQSSCSELFEQLKSNGVPPGVPVAFLGGAFDPKRPASDVWRGWPERRVWLPRLLVWRWGRRAGYITTDEELARKLRRGDVDRWTRSPGGDAEGAITEPIESPAGWSERHAKVLQAVREGAFTKIVMARSASVTGTRAFDPTSVVQRLMRRSADGIVFAVRHGGHEWFVGASPETLVTVRGRTLATHALAGTAMDGDLDSLSRPKELEEHRAVVSGIRRSLTPYCTTLDVARDPTQRRLTDLTHLESAISGTLIDGVSILSVVDALHPTPAVAGTPTSEALGWIRENERLDRGWYAGPIGWLDAYGGGSVHVALRCAFISGNQAQVYAGAGIVAGSQAEQEWDETRWKMRGILESLGAEVHP